MRGVCGRLPHKKDLFREKEIIKLESSANSSFAFNPNVVCFQRHGQQQTFKEQAGEANQVGNYTNYNHNLSRISKNINNGHELKISMGKSSSLNSVQDKEETSTKMCTINKIIVVRKTLFKET